MTRTKLASIIGRLTLVAFAWVLVTYAIDMTPIRTRIFEPMNRVTTLNDFASMAIELRDVRSFTRMHIGRNKYTTSNAIVEFAAQLDRLIEDVAIAEKNSDDVLSIREKIRNLDPPFWSLVFSVIVTRKLLIAVLLFWFWFSLKFA